MAKRAKSTSEIDENALQAVQEGLEVNFDHGAAADEALSSIDDATAALGGRSSEPFHDDASEAPLRPQGPVANDTRRSGMSQLTASLAKRPSSAIMWFAALLSVLWIAAAGWAGYRLLGAELTNVNAWLDITNHPNLIYFAGSVDEHA